jgi:hypothetical protein
VTPPNPSSEGPPNRVNTNSISSWDRAPRHTVVPKSTATTLLKNGLRNLMYLAPNWERRQRARLVR